MGKTPKAPRASDITVGYDVLDTSPRDPPAMPPGDHACSGALPGPVARAAITRCYEEAGAFYVTNEASTSQVNFCPYCGAGAPVQLCPVDPEDYHRVLRTGGDIVWQRVYLEAP
jgi:hypothetical protein